MESNLAKVPPTAPVAPYLGGKRRLAKRIIKRISTIPHHTYVEPFIGMGGVFLRRPYTAPCEVINDLNRDVACLFRILQHHYIPLMDMLRWQITSREHFETLLKANPDSLTDLHRAARFLYLQRTAFGGKVRGQTFGVSHRSARFDIQTLGSVLEDVHARLSRVVIECLPWSHLLPRYDRAETLFYLDPPYWGCERDYGASFEREEFVKLAAMLGALKGRFVLSLNDHPEVRRIFDGFSFEEVEVSYSVARVTAARQFREVLISN
ncbi:DNA adenine methylase [Asaia lannensis]|uniref:DNA adenine methylase n=1 Tax=Asaia lannensis TaxID=415421 RepID=UPI003873411A